jgi:hypothetical protein
MCPNSLEHLGRRATHIVARFAALFADAKGRCYVTEGESELLCVPNECETIHDALAVLQKIGPAGPFVAQAAGVAMVAAGALVSSGSL